MKTDNRGMTLVEAIVASLIMVMGTLILSTGFIAATRMMSVSAAQRTTAESVTATMNGGNRGNTVDKGVRRDITFSIGGYKFDVKNAEVHEYCDSKNDNVKFYRIKQLK